MNLKDGCSIRVAGIPYKFCCNSKIDSGLHSDGLIGQSCHDRAPCLKVMSTLQGAKFTETFLHEVLHAVDVEYPGEERLPEHRIDAFSHGLTQVLGQLGFRIEVIPKKHGR